MVHINFLSGVSKTRGRVPGQGRVRGLSFKKNATLGLGVGLGLWLTLTLTLTLKQHSF